MKFKLIEYIEKYDNEDNELSEQQIEYFQQSKVKINNKLMVCYHGTDSIFDVFEKGDIGFHFGTLEQANYRKEIKNSKDWNILKVYLNIEKYFEFDKDLMMWDPCTIALELLFGELDNTLEYYKDKIKKEEYKIKAYYSEFIGKETELEEIILNYDCKCRDIYNNKYSEKLRRLFKDLGYDGIRYVNQGESDSGDYSYIIFERNQVKNITNKFPTKSDNINEKLYKESKKPTEKEILKIIDDEELESGDTEDIAILFPSGRLIDITD